jgi:hypothetical protein
MSAFSDCGDSNDDGLVRIVIMSRLVYRKGVDLVAQVIPEICEKFPNVRFIVVRESNVVAGCDVECVVSLYAYFNALIHSQPSTPHPLSRSGWRRQQALADRGDARALPAARSSGSVGRSAACTSARCTCAGGHIPELQVGVV